MRTSARKGIDENALEHMTTQIPSLSKYPYTPVLVILLIVASFFLGSLYTKVQYFEKGGKTASGTQTNPPSNAGAAAGTNAQANQPQPTLGKVNVEVGHLPIKGNKDAKVTIVEFSDFQCPFCEQLYKDSLPSMVKDYIDTGKAKLAYRHYPLPFHQNAHRAAEASECANDQGKFWEFHDLLFQNQTAWANQSDADAVTSFKTYAGQLGLDGQAFGTCIESGKFKKAVDDDLNAGQKAGVSGTPTTYINGTQVVGAQPYTSFKSTIDQELANAK